MPDVYLGMVSGAKGVVIWSLFPRREVKRTLQRWYDACTGAAVAVPASGPLRLGLPASGVAALRFFAAPASESKP